MTDDPGKVIPAEPDTEDAPDVDTDPVPETDPEAEPEAGVPLDA